MACSTVTTSAGTLLYAFDLYEVDFSSLWTLMPDVPNINFPLITFSNKVNGDIPVYGTQTGANLQSIYYPTFPNNMQLIDPDLTEFNAQILNRTPSTISYLLSGLNNVFTSTGDITTQITYGINIVVSASQLPEVELERAWDEAWERGLINPTASIMYSYFNLMGLAYEMDIRNSDTSITSFTSWLSSEGVPNSVQSNLLGLNSQLNSGSKSWKTEYNYTNSGFEPYDISSVFFGIQKLKKNPNWTCKNPYNLSTSWTKYTDTTRPRIDALRAYGRLIIPDKIVKVRSGSYEITAADISGSNVISFNIPYGFDVVNFIKSPYGQTFSPSLYKKIIYSTPPSFDQINTIQSPYNLNSSAFIMGPPAIVSFLPGPTGFNYATCDVIGGGDPNPYGTNIITLTLPRGQSIISFYVKDTNCGYINLHMFSPGSSAGIGAFALCVNLSVGASGSTYSQSGLQYLGTKLVYDNVLIENAGSGWKKILVYVTTQITNILDTTANFDAKLALCKSLTPAWHNFSGPGPAGVDGEYIMDNEYDFTFNAGHIQFSSIFVQELVTIQPTTPDPYIPLFEKNWKIDTTILSEKWEFDNANFGAIDAFDNHFTMKLIVPMSLKSDLKNHPSLGSTKITINWTAEFIAITEYIYPYMATEFFEPLYAACESGNSIKSKYVKGTGIIFDVESFASGNSTLQQSLADCKSDILEIYNTYYQYAANFSKVTPYGDILNIHGRYIDAHGSEFFATAKQVLRPQEYLGVDNQDIEIVNLNAIVNAAKSKECTNGQLYNADDLTKTCSNQNINIFQSNQIPMQKSSTNISLSDKLNKIKGKICPVLPPNFTVKK